MILPNMPPPKGAKKPSKYEDFTKVQEPSGRTFGQEYFDFFQDKPPNREEANCHFLTSQIQPAAAPQAGQETEAKPSNVLKS